MTQPGMRSIYERMTQPTAADLAVEARLKELSVAQVGKIVEHMAQMMEHLADKRPDLDVARVEEGNVTGFTVRFANGPVNPLLWQGDPTAKRQD